MSQESNREYQIFIFPSGLELSGKHIKQLKRKRNAKLEIHTKGIIITEDFHRKDYREYFLKEVPKDYFY